MHSSPMRRRGPGLHWPQSSTACSSIPNRAPGRRSVTSVIALLAAVLVATAAVYLLPGRHSPHPVAAPSNSTRRGGTVIAVRSEGLDVQVQLRGTRGEIHQLLITPTIIVATRDGRPLRSTSILPGDILLGGNKRIEDRSQVSVNLAGVVASAPGPGNPIMLLQTSPTRTIVVDLATDTRIVDMTPRNAGSHIILDADQVRAHGVLDTMLNEMTQTDAVVRLGP